MVAAPLRLQRLLLARPGFALRLLALCLLTLRLFPLRLLAPLRIALGLQLLAPLSLLAQRLRIVLRRPAGLFDLLRVQFAPLLLVAFRHGFAACLLAAPLRTRLLIAPLLFGALGDLLLPRLFPLRGGLAAGLLGNARSLFAPGLLGSPGDLLAPGLLRTARERVAPRLIFGARLLDPARSAFAPSRPSRHPRAAPRRAPLPSPAAQRPRVRLRELKAGAECRSDLGRLGRPATPAFFACWLRNCSSRRACSTCARCAGSAARIADAAGAAGTARGCEAAVRAAATRCSMRPLRSGMGGGGTTCALVSALAATRSQLARTGLPRWKSSAAMDVSASVSRW